MVDENNPQVEIERVLAPVNRAMIIPKPDFLSSYRLKAIVPYYFDEISLQIEGFIGTAANPNQPFILGL